MAHDAAVTAMFAAARNLFRRSAADPAKRGEPAGAWRQQGNDALTRGDLAAAADCYRQGTQPPPGHPVAWLNLGYVQLEMQQHEAARESLARAESLLDADAPERPDVWALLGRERQERRDWAAAEAHYRRLVERVPGHALAWRELGQVCEKQGRLGQAEAAYGNAVALQGDFGLALQDLARLLCRLHRDDEALPFIEHALALGEPDASLHLLHGHALWRTARLDQALEKAQLAVDAGLGEEAANLRGIVLTSLNRLDEALACHDEVLARNPDCVVALVDSARALMHARRDDEALRRLDRALQLEPGRRDALTNKAAVFAQQLRCDDALDLLENQLGHLDDDAEAAFLAATLRLQKGDFESGFDRYEARWRLWREGVPPRKPAFNVPEWSGEPLEHRSILLYTEQGFGDSIQFFRFVPELARRAGRVWLDIPSSLWPVLPQLPVNVELVRPDQSRPINYVLPLLSLPRVFGTTLQTLPNAVPYLRVPAERKAFWRERLGARKRYRVGLVWSGNPRQANDHNRSIPLERFLPHVPEGVEFVSLQKVVRQRDVEALRAFPGIRHFGDELATFGDTAALASEMDLVISVCTSVVHLAGALGLPTAVLLCHAPDWRWMLGRDDSPWYPTARLFRQQRAGDWDSTIARAMDYVRRQSGAVPAAA